MISIIVPVYNSEKYLDECLKSIQKQSYRNFEVICVDDGSTDNSANIVNEYIKTDTRFQLFTQSNSGVSAARNLGLSKVSGEFICFVDSDDIIDNLFLENLINLAKDGSFAVCSYSRNIRNLGTKARNVRHYSSREYITNIINERFEHPNIWILL